MHKTVTKETGGIGRSLNAATYLHLLHVLKDLFLVLQLQKVVCLAFGPSYCAGHGITDERGEHGQGANGGIVQSRP